MMQGLTPEEVVLHQQLADARAEAQELRTERDQLRERMAWRPIETAPRDGTLVIGFAIVDTETGNWNQKIISYDNYAEVGIGHRWHGWSHWREPTHWLPLPEPPKDAAIERQEG